MHDLSHSISIEGTLCRGRRRCMRVCPTEAIRVRDGHAVLLADRCIDCGECVRVCPNHAIVPRTGAFSEFSRFKYTIAVPSPVFYSQFGKDVPPSAILSALKRIGFDDACDAALPSEYVSIAIQDYLDTTDSPRPFISPFCPTIVRLIQSRYPNLLDNLIPIESPMEIAAREAKQAKMKQLGLRESEIGIIYITPCPAKMMAIKHPPRKRHSFLDGTIAINEIYPAVTQVLPSILSDEPADEIYGLGLGWPILGGQVACLKAEDCLAIAGLNDAERIFGEIEKGMLRDIHYIEVHSCPTACVGGSLTVENAYIARGRVLRMLRKLGSKPTQDREKIRGLHRKNFFSLPGKIRSIPDHSVEKDLSKGLVKLQQKAAMIEILPQIDCGACGSPTCSAFAEDVVHGRSKSDNCVFLAIKRNQWPAGGGEPVSPGIEFKKGI